MKIEVRGAGCSGGLWCSGYMAATTSYPGFESLNWQFLIFFSFLSKQVAFHTLMNHQYTCFYIISTLQHSMCLFLKGIQNRVIMSYKMEFNWSENKFTLSILLNKAAGIHPEQPNGMYMNQNPIANSQTSTYLYVLG